MTAPFLKVPAISVSQPVGEFFLCSIPASALLQITYSIPASMTRTKGIFSNIFGNQRSKSTSRPKQIGSYIDEEESTFPNTIILSANYLKDGAYLDDEELRWQVIKEENGFYSLLIPTNLCAASIIDGQHRLEGFKNVRKADRLNMGLPCAVFINLPRSYQAKIFASININQKRVDKSLAYQLFGYDLNEANTDKWPPDMLGVYLARILEGEDGSPFKGHIKLALLEENAKKAIKDKSIKKDTNSKWAVSVACIVEGVTGLIADKPISDRSALAEGQIQDRSFLPIDNSPLREMYLKGKDKSLLELVKDYFNIVEQVLWKNQPDRSFITRTVGILALFDVLRDGIKAHQIDINNVSSSSKKLLISAQGINFSDDFFHASGAGRVRIRNVLKLISGLSDTADESVIEAVERLKTTRLKVVESDA